jgi:hypothetical protein
MQTVLEFAPPKKNKFPAHPRIEAQVSSMTGCKAWFGEKKSGIYFWTNPYDVPVRTRQSEDACRAVRRHLRTHAGVTARARTIGGARALGIILVLQWAYHVARRHQRQGTG